MKKPLVAGLIIISAMIPTVAKADTITIRKSPLSIYDDYQVEEDGHRVGRFYRNPLSIYEDDYTFIDEEDNRSHFYKKPLSISEEWELTSE